MIKGAFFEFNVARSALFTAQANMQVTSHNIANAATTGYSRQYGVTVASNPMRGNGTGMYGTGSEVTTVARHRNQFLDQKYWSQKAVHSNYETKKPILESMERMFISISADGIKNTLMESFSDLEAMFSDLSTNANDGTYRNNVVGSAESLAQNIASIGQALTEKQASVNEEIVISVGRMNAIADQIARLSSQIKNAEFRGDIANDLRDQRETLIDELSGYANLDITERQVNPAYDPTDPYSPAPIYEYKVAIDGNLFISGDYVNHLELVNRDSQIPPIKLNPNDTTDLYDIKFESGAKFGMYETSLSGSLKALIDLRDGNNSRGLSLTQGTDADGKVYGQNEYGEEFYRTTNFKGIPHYLDRLNELVRTFSRAMNEGEDINGNPLEGVVGHVDGYDLHGETGRFFFTLYDDAGNQVRDIYDDSVSVYDYTDPANPVLVTKKYSDLTDAEKSSLYNNTKWHQFTTNKDLVDDPDRVATSSIDGDGESDNKVSLGVSNLLSNPDLFAAGKLSDFVIGISSELAVSSKQAFAFSDKYQDVIVAADNQRLAVSNVNINEESVNMVKFQQMYQAAAKMITIIDQIYDTTINRLI